MSISFNRVDQDGRVTARGSVPSPEDFIALKAGGFPGEYVLGDRPPEPPPRVELPVPVLDLDVVSVEELADAVIKLAAGDKSAVDGIAAKRRRSLQKVADSGSDKRRPAQRSAGRNKAASKRRVPVQPAR
jgi:hypothetical protein